VEFKRGGVSGGGGDGGRRNLQVREDELFRISRDSNNKDERIKEKKREELKTCREGRDSIQT